MCREGAWAELTVKVTFMGVIQSKTHGFKIKIVGWNFLNPALFAC